MKLLWIDMEMTGLDVEREVIIEVAAVVSDFEFKTLDTYHAAITQPQKFFDGMDDWNKKHHHESGLVDMVKREGQDPLKVESDLVALCQKHFPDGPAVIAGNSIGQDRAFINRYMPRFAAKLHYRMLDVTSWKIVFNNKYNIKYSKKGAHRAIDDIYESMAELKFYLNQVRT